MLPSLAPVRKSWNSSPKSKSVADTTLAQENGTAFSTLEIDTTAHAHELKKKDKELLDILKKHKPEDAEINKIKINKELDDAINGLQAKIENDIASLKAHKEMNLCLINKIKNEHTVLIDEKHYIEKQLELASRSCNGQNKRKSKEVDGLNTAYIKLDQQERSARRRIAILKAELSLIILKLEDVSNSKEEKPVVPPLDLSKLGERKVWPPFKNAPKAPKKGMNRNYLVKENFTDISTGNKRRMKDQEPKNKTGSLNALRNQPDKKTVRQVIYKNKPVLTRKDEGTQLEVLKLPNIVKGSQMIDTSKIVPKQSCESRKNAPRCAARKPKKNLISKSHYQNFIFFCSICLDYRASVNALLTRI